MNKSLSKNLKQYLKIEVKLNRLHVEQDKADTLLGILQTLCDNLPDKLNNSDLEHFKNIGTHLRISHEMHKTPITKTKKSGYE